MTDSVATDSIPERKDFDYRGSKAAHEPGCTGCAWKWCDAPWRDKCSQCGVEFANNNGADEVIGSTCHDCLVKQIEHGGSI